MKIILASGSPRRKEILTEFGYEFSVNKSDFLECDEQTDAISVAVKNAKGKASDVFSRLQKRDKADDGVVIGADTVVYYNGVILGKPKDRTDAVKTLRALSGKTHQVITGFCVLSKKFSVFGFDESTVRFNALSDASIKEYVDKFSPLDKAGSYGIQDDFPLVERVEGSMYNVIGFPIEKIKPILDEIGL